MANLPENTSMALFCDFENVALGVRDAKYDRFDIKRVLERLLLKGSIVVKKAYCDWDRYKPFKAAMHEANFELIEIPHVRQSGKNSADIRLVVDALDLCYTKSHVNTFVIISGDSDFSPLVSKLRENAKQVIGVGVKQSTSDLLIANCDEFIFYDDLVREGQRAQARRQQQQPPAEAAVARRPADDDTRRKEDAEARKGKAIDMAVETFEALVAERGDSGRIWPSMVKQALKRRKPDFAESYFGFRSFGSLLEEAQARGLIELGRDEKGNVYVQRSGNAGPVRAPAPSAAAPSPAAATGRSRRGGRGGEGAPAAREARPMADEPDFAVAGVDETALQRAEPEPDFFAPPLAGEVEPVVDDAVDAAGTELVEPAAPPPPESPRRGRGGRRTKVPAGTEAPPAAVAPAEASPVADAVAAPAGPADAGPAGAGDAGPADVPLPPADDTAGTPEAAPAPRKRASRPRRPKAG